MPSLGKTNLLDNNKSNSLEEKIKKYFLSKTYEDPIILLQTSTKNSEEILKTLYASFKYNIAVNKPDIILRVMDNYCGRIIQHCYEDNFLLKNLVDLYYIIRQILDNMSEHVTISHNNMILYTDALCKLHLDSIEILFPPNKLLTNITFNGDHWERGGCYFIIKLAIEAVFTLHNIPSYYVGGKTFERLKFYKVIKDEKQRFNVLQHYRSFMRLVFDDEMINNEENKIIRETGIKNTISDIQKGKNADIHKLEKCMGIVYLRSDDKYPDPNIGKIGKSDKFSDLSRAASGGSTRKIARVYNALAVEAELKRRFNEHFELMSGTNEYFKGNPRDMSKLFNEVVEFCQNDFFKSP